MNHSTTYYGIALLCLFGVLQGCTFEQGNSWGKVRPEVAVRFDAEDRRTEDGALRVGNGYEVRLDELTLGVTSLRVDAAPEGAAVSSFDPASPPPGYSLCHNGHCHADDGSLVDYEDIALELQSASGQVSAAQVTQAYEASVDVTEHKEYVLDADPALCSNACGFATRGELTRVTVTLGTMRVRGVAYDTTMQSRLPEQGLEFDVMLAEPITLQGVIEGSLGEEPELLVEADLRVDDDLFGDVNWEEVARDSSELVRHFSSTPPIDLTLNTRWETP